MKRVAIVGAGPVGLAAAAHVLERGMTPIVLETGPEVGHAVRQWGHVRMFSPWTYNVDQAASRLLEAAGWNKPDGDTYPHGAELVDQYLAPLAKRTPLADHVHTCTKVVAIARAGFDKVKTAGRGKAPFELHVANGRAAVIAADAVIDASGTWFSPNPAGANGLPAKGERENADRIAYGMPETARYAGKTVAVLGSGHSAIGTLIELARLPATRPIWLLRGEAPEKAFGGGVKDKLVERGALGTLFAGLVRSGRIEVRTGFRVREIERAGEHLRIRSGSCCQGQGVLVDELVVATGLRPDHSFLRELRLALDPALECPPALAPLIDPNLHSCGTVRPHGARELTQPEPGLYLAGMKSYGRAPTFLMITGYEQVRSIVADIAEDREAAERVELVLPETGVCSGPGEATAKQECCGGPPSRADAGCCKADEAAKAEGMTGCGCG
jgi:thioredoxin reductase